MELTQKTATRILIVGTFLFITLFIVMATYGDLKNFNY